MYPMLQRTRRLPSKKPSIATILRQNKNLEDDCSQAEGPLRFLSMLTSRVLITDGSYASIARGDCVRSHSAS